MKNNELKKRILSSLVLIPITFFLVIKGSYFFITFLSIIYSISIYEWFKMCKKGLIKILGIIFLSFSFYSAFLIREYSGLYFFLFIVLICIFTDIGGYVFGKVFKGPKLIKLSPNKTYSGVAGGLFFALIAGFLYLKFVEITIFKFDDIIKLYVILIISFISQIGDLIISYFKRKAKLKDTGNILPGHGGLLDRIDGLIFVIPIVYLKIFILS
tara:strand:- start:41 stop:679 length:639 start_codon:yes stop_codon:yes gene_type:complete